MSPVASRSLGLLILGAIWCMGEKTALADAFNLFGVEPVGLAEASARAADADDGSACFYNPGGLSLGHGYRLSVSGLGIMSRLHVQGRRTQIDDPFGATLTVASAVPLEGWLRDRLRVGLVLHSLPDRLMRLKVQRRSTPSFPYYEGRSQRSTFIPALSLRLARGLGFGVGVNLLAGVQGPIDVREGQSKTLETRFVQESGTVARWVAGIRFDPEDRVHLAAVYRQHAGVPMSVTTTADVAGVPLVVDVSTAEALFDPTTFILGARLTPSEEASFGVDLVYRRWSAWQGPAVQVDATVSALSLATEPRQDLFQDTYGARSAVAWRLTGASRGAITLHAGAGYERSMIDASVQQGRTNLVDGPKIILGSGFSARFPHAVGEALRVGLGVQVHQVMRFEQDKVACERPPCPASTVAGPDAANPSAGIDNPGYPSLSGAGAVLSASFGVGVEL